MPDKNLDQLKAPIESETKLEGVVVIVDDMEGSRLMLEDVCSKSTRCKLNTVSFGRISEALDYLAQNEVHVVLLDRDFQLPEGRENGIDFIPQFKGSRPCAQLLMVTATNDPSEIVRAIQLGASNYLIKDGKQSDLMLAQIEVALAQAIVDLQCTRTERLQTKSNEVDFIGNSPAIRKLKDQLELFAKSDLPILLLGEPGTGKTTSAKWIHEKRNDIFKQQTEAPFISVEMSSIPANLMEGEFFGWEKSSFTSADKMKVGLAELANGGTLFLDELGELPLELQPKFLRLMQSGEYRRIGGTGDRKSTFKLICATNRDLEKMVAEGKFREDLYHRLSTFTVTVPSLKDRSDDIPNIVRNMLSKLCVKNRVQKVAFEELPDEFIDYLKEHPPYGNFRGIDHQLSRLLVLSPVKRNGRKDFSNWKNICVPKTKISSLPSKDELRFSINLQSPSFSGLDEVLHDIEDRIWSKALEIHKSRPKAAEALKVPMATAYRRIRNSKSKNGVLQTDQGSQERQTVIHG